MRFRTRLFVALTLVVAICAGWMFEKSAQAQAQPDAGRSSLLPSYAPAIESIMELLGKGKIDDALATIDFYKDQPDAKEEMRARLIHFYSLQQRYTGYDVVAVQRFSPRLQSVSVLAYYDLQPVLFHFDFYHADASGSQPWIIPGFSMHENVVEDLKDLPIDYHPTAR